MLSTETHTKIKPSIIYLFAEIESSESQENPIGCTAYYKLWSMLKFLLGTLPLFEFYGILCLFKMQCRNFGSAKSKIISLANGSQSDI